MDLTKKKVAIFTFARSEYGLLRWIIEEVEKSDHLDLRLFVGGAHLSRSHGLSYNDILKEGMKINYILDFLIDRDDPSALSKSVGVAVISISQIFSYDKPDIIVILGDRYELYSVAINAILFNIPIVHIAGGEVTLGAIDEQIRHSITKVSHIHVVSTEEYALNVSRMGEEDWRIHILGSPGIENIYKMRLKNPAEIKGELGVDITQPTILVTYHPVTLEKRISTVEQVNNLLYALDHFKDFQIIFTAPGADIEYGVVLDKIKKFVSVRKKAYLFYNLGSNLYLSIMKHSKAVVGNSSSGIIEAPSLKVPTVNIGDRQKGRIAAESVIHCGYSKDEIIKGIEKAIYDQKFLEIVRNVKNPYDPYGDGNFSGRLVKVINNLEINERLLRKELDFEVKPHLWNSLLKE